MRFALALHVRSGRWIPPVLLLATWIALVVANPGSALDNAANLFFPVLIVAVWCTSGIGNADDDPHRDLCAAAIGGPGRLSVARHLGALVELLPVAVIVGILGITSGRRDGASWPTVIAGAAGLLLSAVLLGVAIGALLHRPVLRSAASTLLLAVVAILVVVLLPPVRDALHDADHARVGGSGILFAVSIGIAATSCWAAAMLAARTS